MTKYILSVAGGGIRGVAVASFLREVEKFLRTHNGNSLYDQFDIYTGSSTGALITAGIAYNGMDGEELENIYSYENANEIMNESWFDWVVGIFQTQPKYKGFGKRRIIRKFATDTRIDQTDKDVLIPIYDITHEKPLFIKSWQHQHSLTLTLDATTAAPGYFPSVEYMPDCYAIDGGVVCNNPSLATYIEAKELYPDEKIVLVSIGTGYNSEHIGKVSRTWGGIQWLIKGNLMGLLMDAPLEGNLEYTARLIESRGDKFVHIDGFLEDTTMDNCSRSNIEKLKQFGKDLWRDNINVLKHAFGHPTVHSLVEREVIFL